MSPFLKWAGGKRWLTNSKEFPRPQAYRRYIEPFLGSGAVFFSLSPDASILSDLNADLIGLYTAVRDNPVALENALQLHQLEHSADYYYSVRAAPQSDPIACAARFLYLNRTCWNGLYRVNQRGEFNVPIGTKNAVILPDDNFIEVSARLQNATIGCCDFEQTIDEAKSRDFVFVDPPYTVQHNNNGFIKYNEQLFTWNDQVRLRNAVERAVIRGATVVVTNADHSSIHELYGDMLIFKRMTRSSVLAASSSKRNKVTEALFYSKDLEQLP